MKKIVENGMESPMTIGELAKKLGVTVRTLQYYDKQGLLTPSAKTSGGRRFYTKKDMIKLHQILSMKYLGFSLDDIKNGWMKLDTPEDVMEALELQRQMLKEQEERISQALLATEILQQEVRQMHTVDFDKYSNIVLLLREKSESYWLFKFLGEKLSKHVSEHFGNNIHEWAELYKRWNATCDATILLEKEGVPWESEEAQRIAKEWWDMTLDFSGGDLSLVEELKKFEEDSSGWSEDMRKKVLLVKNYRSGLMKQFFKGEDWNPLV